MVPETLSDDHPAPLVNPEWLTPEEAAALLRVNRNTLYKAIHQGEIPHVRLGRTYRISRYALVRGGVGAAGALRASDDPSRYPPSTLPRRIVEGPAGTGWVHPLDG